MKIGKRREEVRSQERERKGVQGVRKLAVTTDRFHRYKHKALRKLVNVFQQIKR